MRARSLKGIKPEKVISQMAQGDRIMGWEKTWRVNTKEDEEKSRDGFVRKRGRRRGIGNEKRWRGNGKKMEEK